MDVIKKNLLNQIITTIDLRTSKYNDPLSYSFCKM